MAIKHIAKKYEYIGLSTDDKSDIMTEGATIYYIDKGYAQKYHNGTWYDDANTEIKNSLDISMGFIGSETITDTEEHTGDFYWITVLEDATISSITLDSEESGNAITGFALPAGFSNPLLCTEITLSSGKVRMAKKG
jgi:hypothetical protein